MKSRYLSSAEIKRLREALTPGEWLPFAVALETGIRIGDIAALKVRSIQADGIHYTAAKTKKRGVAPISAALRKSLPRAGKWLFPSPYLSEKHITRQALWARMKRAAHRAGVEMEGVSPHALRKDFAVELYKAKGFAAVMAALQHANAATSEIYAFSDFSTGENADLPLRRGDLALIVRMCLEALGDRRFVKESKKKSPKKEP